ncbi:multicopper oxidase [Legionella cincinnatiensis]|uniref:Multicopper oxidase n=1 Tax=Legionella cincinnatiensis TaxID=28085 RepID=A0A378IJ66_9GAMM|nr:multicopper oxidase domain-containing protein [Legionella cincinnatiensis]KTC93226.1 multicopper oxidase [Legionella cincinnatiensis]STX35073.1 multicopper oxidase [Legionella cincinnatiensis]
MGINTYRIFFKKFSFVLFSTFFLFSFSIDEVIAANRVINLEVGYKTVYFAQKPKKAIAVNQQIPAPTLHFKEGDHVTINVANHLDQGTAIHWHGILVPWQMDGVEGVSQTEIPPGGTFRYQFTLKQSGTYWYHAHAGLQEQQGLYGAFIVDPLKHPKYTYTKDYVIVLSDWINTQPNQVQANLKKSGDYYAPRFPLQPSLAKFIHDYQKDTKKERLQLMEDYKTMQQMRMSIYDISDVAYDAFLLNGHTNANPWTAPVKVGDIVRLRFIDAGSSTIFRIKIPGTTMKVVHIQGNDVKPYSVKNLTIAPAETYDVLVKIDKNKPYIIYAASKDTVGTVFGALKTNTKQFIDSKVKPFPEPIPVTQEMMNIMMGGMYHGSLPSNTPKKHPLMASKNPKQAMKMDHSMRMDHSMKMPIEPTRFNDTIAPTTPSFMTSLDIKYRDIFATAPTNNPNKPVEGIINLELFGYMGQYIWFINGTPGYKAKPIPLKPGKRYRFVFTNTSMMHHPMHLHGHWFILRTGKNSFDPLMHTLDIPPGATITADVDTDASGQWFFHCHMLYHMMSGMSRVFQYSTLIAITNGKLKPENIDQNTKYRNRPIVRVDEAIKPINSSLVKHPMAHNAGFWMATYLDVGADPFHNAQRLTYKGMYGPDYNKLELFTNDAEIYKGVIENADIDIFYWHLISQFWAIKGGANYFNQPAAKPYWQAGIGIEGLMPFFIATDIRTYFYGGSVKFDIELARDTQITNNFLIKTGVRSIIATKTVIPAEIGSGLNQMRYTVRPYYRLMPGLSIFVEYENEHDYGAFKIIEDASTVPDISNTVSLGATFLF